MRKPGLIAAGLAAAGILAVASRPEPYRWGSIGPGHRPVACVPTGPR
jgi:hypothetical protein